jgi:hypothetical protein
MSTPTARLTILLAVTVASATLSVSSASATRPDPVVAPTGPSCSTVLRYVVDNPSMNKPRGHQDAPDGWSWRSGCL